MPSIKKSFTTKEIEHIMYLNEMTSVMNLNKIVGDGTGDELVDFIKAPSLTPEEIVYSESLADLLNKVMYSALNARERDVITKRFGLFNTESYTLEEIGEGYGLTRERIRQIEAKALRKLKNNKYLKDNVKMEDLLYGR